MKDVDTINQFNDLVIDAADAGLELEVGVNSIMIGICPNYRSFNTVTEAASYVFGYVDFIEKIETNR